MYSIGRYCIQFKVHGKFIESVYQGLSEVFIELEKRVELSSSYREWTDIGGYVVHIFTQRIGTYCIRLKIEDIYRTRRMYHCWALIVNGSIKRNVHVVETFSSSIGRNCLQFEIGDIHRNKCAIVKLSPWMNRQKEIFTLYVFLCRIYWKIAFTIYYRGCLSSC